MESVVRERERERERERRRWTTTIVPSTTRSICLSDKGDISERSNKLAKIPSILTVTLKYIIAELFHSPLILATFSRDWRILFAFETTEIVLSIGGIVCRYAVSRLIL